MPHYEGFDIVKNDHGYHWHHLETDEVSVEDFDCIEDAKEDIDFVKTEFELVYD